HPSASQHNLDVRFTPKADMCSATSDVRFGPKADMRNDRVRSLGLCFAISPMTQRDRLTKVTLPYRATIELNDHAVGRVTRAFVPIFDPETIRRKPIDPSSRWACCWAQDIQVPLVLGHICWSADSADSARLYATILPGEIHHLRRCFGHKERGQRSNNAGQDFHWITSACSRQTPSSKRGASMR